MEENKTEGGVVEPKGTGVEEAKPTDNDTEKVEEKTEEKEDDKEMINISRGELRGILGEVKEDITKEFNKELEKRDDALTVLREASDLNRLTKVENKRKGPIVHTLRISTYDGQVMVAWKMLKDEVYKNESNAWVEKQSIEVTLEDGKKIEFASYKRFDELRRAGQKVVEILGKEVTSDEDVIYRVKHPLKAGKEIKLSSPFVN